MDGDEIEPDGCRQVILEQPELLHRPQHVALLDDPDAVDRPLRIALDDPDAVAGGRERDRRGQPANPAAYNKNIQVAHPASGGEACTSRSIGPIHIMAERSQTVSLDAP